MRRHLSLFATLFGFLLLLAACGGSTDVGTSSGDDPVGNDVTEGSLPLLDEPVDDPVDDEAPVEAPVEDTVASLPVPDEGTNPVEIDGEHVITNDAIVDPQVTSPTELVLNPENDRELWVRFVSGDPNCTAASATIITETPDTVQVELLVGITEDALARSCMAGEFNSRVNVALNESAVGKTLGAVQAGPPEAQLVTPDLSVDDFVGLTVEEAEAIVEENQLTARTLRIDDEFFAVTEDFRPERLNFEVDDGVITSASLG